MSWNPWQITHLPPSGQIPTSGQLPASGQMPSAEIGSYSSDQVIAWQQYQQQYQQWHEKYYEQYQKEMHAHLRPITNASTAIAQYQMSPYTAPPSMSQPPPPLTTNTIQPQPPPPPISNAIHIQPPPPPPPPSEGTSNQINLNVTNNNNHKTRLDDLNASKKSSMSMVQNSLSNENTNFITDIQINPNYELNLNQKPLMQKPISYDSKTEIGTNYATAKPNCDLNLNKAPLINSPIATNTSNTDVEKTPEDIVFDEQFRKWEEQIENWKKENANHPDRKAYREYEMQFEECRNKLIERRNAMIKRKLEHQQQQQLQELKLQNRLKKTAETPKTSNFNQNHARYANSNTVPTFYTNNCNSNNPIPGLDLVDKKTFSKDYAISSNNYKRNSLKSNEPSSSVSNFPEKIFSSNNNDINKSNFVNSSNNVLQVITPKKIPSLFDQKFEKPSFMNENFNSVKQPTDKSNESHITILSDKKLNIENFSALNKENPVNPPVNTSSNDISALANVLSDPNVMAILNAALKSNTAIDSLTQPNLNLTQTTFDHLSFGSQNCDKTQFSDFLKQKQPVNRIFNPKERQYVTEVVPQPKFIDSCKQNRWGENLRNNFYENENLKPNWKSDHNNSTKTLNFEDNSYRPAQVIDYQNRSVSNETRAEEDLGSKKVVDYGHKPKSQKQMKNDNSSISFVPGKTIDYAHSSDKCINDKKDEEIKLIRKERKIMKKEQKMLKKPIYESNDIYPGPWNMLNKETRKRTGFPTKRAKRKKAKLIDKSEQKIVKVNEKNNILKEDYNYDQDLEEISDEDEMSLNNDRSPNIKDSPLSISQISDIPEKFDKKNDDVQMIFPTNENNNTIRVDEILFNPGRKTRPKKIVVILRGPPGSGKSYVARLIKEKENELSGTMVRLLSIDDYFMVETDKTEKCDKTGRPINKKVMIYEYDGKMEEQYVQYLIKAFKKTLSDSLYDFVIIDYGNQSLRTFTEFYNTSRAFNYTPYTVDMITDLNTCLEQNIHNRDLEEIKDMIDNWMNTPQHYIKLNISSLLLKDIELDNISISESEHSEISKTEKADVEEYNRKSEYADFSTNILKSKWDTDFSVEGLARLDGASKKNYQKRSTMQDYLQLEDIWEPPKSSNSNKKRVRWADIEEKKAQDKMRAIGFIVGHTDWKRMMDPTQGSSALTKTKYIDKIKKPQRK